MEPVSSIIFLSASLSSLLEFTLDISLVPVEAVESLRVGTIKTIGVAPATLPSVLAW